jgi:hypothetical protein
MAHPERDREQDIQNGTVRTGQAEQAAERNRENRQWWAKLQL